MPQIGIFKVYAADGMPQMICTGCRWNIDRCYKFKLQCRKADEALRDYPLSGVLPRPFPPIPNDPPEISNKRIVVESKSQNETTNKKLRSDTNDRRETRERERERNRERERQNEKREKSNEQLHDFYEEEQDGGSEGEQEASPSKEEVKLEPGEIRVHACDQCDRTFPLRQALVVHALRAHRDRNFKCTECDRSFFSKYDLAKHMSTHSEEKPYSCPICNKQFSRANLLQRHEKVHRDEIRYGCQHCDREFFSPEELEKHEDATHKKDKPFQCNICNKHFQYKQGLERHEMMHNEDKTFVCEYCKEAFHTSTKLARHLSTHAGHRPYLCKLCPRTFLLSHHLTRHMRTHSVEKRHVCEDCGKAFKRKESLEVHQLTHTKRTGMGLTCDVCQESCRNRADYVTHIKQHIEAGEKMGPDGLQPDSKMKVDMDSDDEDNNEEDQYSDDDYEPPPHIVKKLPKMDVSESEEDDEERQENEEHKEQVVFVRGKDGNMMKKTIKTLMPIQRREVQDSKTIKSPILTSSQSSSKTSSSSQGKQEESSKGGRSDETEAQVQKIVASVFKEHKIPLKHQNASPEQTKKVITRYQTALQEARKDEKGETIVASTPKITTNTQVFKRYVLKKPGDAEGTPIIKDTESLIAAAQKKSKRVIVRRIIRQGDTTREIVMNPDGTMIDPSELAKLPTGNVVKRVVMKRPLDKRQNLVQTVLQTLEKRQKTGDSILNEAGTKFELKTSAPTTPKSSQKTQLINQGDQETKEKLEQLEKRVEQQRLKIEELQARKQQEYEAIDEMLPERHDESEDEQQLPLKRVFVKRKQSIYDEEQEYNDNDTEISIKVSPPDTEAVIKEKSADEEKTSKDDTKESQIASAAAAASVRPAKTQTKQGPTISSNKVYTNKKYIVVKPNETSEVEEMSRELCSILETTDNTVKMQETVLSNLTEISGVAETSPTKQKNDSDEVNTVETINPTVMEVEGNEQIVNVQQVEAEVTQETDVKYDEKQEETQVVAQEKENEQSNLVLNSQDLSETVDIFEPSDVVLETPKSNNTEDSVIELSQTNETINLNDTNDSQDSLEDKLSQMEG